MRLLSTVLLCCLLFPAAAQQPAERQFGLSLAPSTDGQLFCLFLVKVREGQVVESRPLSRENFIRQAQGRAFSPANPDAEDLFRKHGVEQCTLPPDSAAMGFLTDCSTLDDLWKLRYWEYPQQVEQGQRMAKGWSERPLAPSPRQLEILNCYGLKHAAGMITGPDLFLLLRDMGDPEWVNIYRRGA